VRRSSRIAKDHPERARQSRACKGQGQPKKALADENLEAEDHTQGDRDTKGDKKARPTTKAALSHAVDEHAFTKKTEGTKRKRSQSTTELRKRAGTNAPDSTDSLPSASQAESAADSDHSEGSNKRERSAGSEPIGRKRTRTSMPRSAEASLPEHASNESTDAGLSVIWEETQETVLVMRRR
jgi:hypothetical protein